MLASSWGAIRTGVKGLLFVFRLQSLITDCSPGGINPVEANKSPFVCEPMPTDEGIIEKNIKQDLRTDHFCCSFVHIKSTLSAEKFCCCRQSLLEFCDGGWRIYTDAALRVAE